MESAGRERGKEVRKRPAGGAERHGNAKKILNRGNEPNKSFGINKSRKKRTQNELDFEPNNAQITPKKRVLGGVFHVAGGFSVEVARAGVRFQVSGARVSTGVQESILRTQNERSEDRSQEIEGRACAFGLLLSAHRLICLHRQPRMAFNKDAALAPQRAFAGALN